MSDTTEAMRAAFEAWAETLTDSIGRSAFLGRRDTPGSERAGEYVVSSVEMAWLAWQASHPTPAAPAVTDRTHTGSVPDAPTTDQLIELTAHLERVRAKAIVEAVEKIGADIDPDCLGSHWCGWASALEEVKHRVQTEAWGMLPNGGWGPTGAANENDRPSPEFPGLLRRALAAQPSPERSDCEQPRGTDAQIRKERELTCAAIDGAMAFGYRGGPAPTADSLWLLPFFKVGADQARLERACQRPIGPTSCAFIREVECVAAELEAQGRASGLMIQAELIPRLRALAAQQPNHESPANSNPGCTGGGG